MGPTSEASTALDPLSAPTLARRVQSGGAPRLQGPAPRGPLVGARETRPPLQQCGAAGDLIDAAVVRKDRPQVMDCNREN